MQSEVNCLCNVASERKVLLTLGAKKNETPTDSTTIASTSSVQKISNVPLCPDDKSIHIFHGDRVIVTNHGNLFPTAVVKKINYEENTAQIKWDTSRTITTISIRDICAIILMMKIQRGKGSKPTFYTINTM
jgi:hypothetical protein